MRILLLIVFALLGIFATPSDIIQEFQKANAQFSADVYKELLKIDSGNFLVCPLSAEIVLALSHAGAKGNTAKEISSGLHLPEDQETIQKMFTQLSPILRAVNEYNLTIANKVYVADHLKLTDEFNNTAITVFGATAEGINFNEKEKAAVHINKWVEETTKEKIKKLVKENQLTSDTVAVLINAVYLKAEWENEFISLEMKFPFSVGGEKQIEVDMMKTVGEFNYYYNSELKIQFLELPYKGNDLTMTIVLPDDKDSLPALEARIIDVLSETKLEIIPLEVIIPKFKIETDISFKPVLENLGIKTMFESEADFSGLTTAVGPIYVKDVIQKTLIEVDEKGTTAASSTAIFYANRISNTSRRFFADHPFAFYLKHKISGILFVGRFSMPENGI